MRIPRYSVAWAAALLANLLQSANGQQPFLPAATPTVPYELSRRQQNGGCWPGTYSCAQQGAIFNNICCTLGQVCALDQTNSPACCPAGAVCTGTAPAQFLPPQTAVSYVPNQYFSFPYIPTVFANQAACTSAVVQCSRNYDACTAFLQGQVAPNPTGGYGVTINVPGPGGTTIVGGPAGAPASAVNYGPATATSVCGSLSRVGCYGINNNVCATTGGSGTGFFVGAGNAAVARATPPPVAVMGVGVMAGLGAAWGAL